MLKKILLFLTTILFISNTSCVSKKIINGQMPSGDNISTLKIGKDKRNIVKKILGSPSFNGGFGDNSIYYVLTVSDQVAFLEPSLINQKILQIKFDKNNILEDIFLYNKNDSKKIKMSSNFTKTTGKKISILEQLISNFGVPVGGRSPVIGSGRAGD